MRVLAPAPASATEGLIANDYQLCARCGKVLIEGDRVVVVRRLCSWLIYAHPVGPACPPKAVRGWLAAGKADTVRDLNNQEVFRTAEPYRVNGVSRSAVCLLDDKHIETELRLVSYYPSDETPTNGTDVRSLLFRRQLRVAGNGKHIVFQGNEEGDRTVIGRRETVIRNFVEDEVIAALDRNSLTRFVRTLTQIVWSCRNRTYAAFRTPLPIDPTPHAFIGLGSVPRPVCVRQRTRLPKADCDAFARDLKGRRVEFPLYSNKKVVKICGKGKSEFECWTPEKPQPVDIGYSCKTRPDMYDWNGDSKSRRTPVDSKNPYGPVAVLRLAAPFEQQ